MAKPSLKPRKQVAALAIRRDPTEGLKVMLVTSRQTRRLVTPKGWRMKGRQDYVAAEIEAKQEAGVIGRIHKKPIGFYEYWKRLADHFVLCRVKVFVLEVERQLADWKERGERRVEWFDIDEAADLVDEPGMSAIIRDLPARMKALR
jgi:8-oxo-dGTP pyrophosphatase MutT (NUDIX family)